MKEGFFMKIEFCPKALVEKMAIQDKVGNNIRRVFTGVGRHNRTVEMIYTPTSYPKEYYVSSFRVFDNKGVRKEMNRTADGHVTIQNRSLDGTYYTKNVK